MQDTIIDDPLSPLRDTAPEDRAIMHLSIPHVDHYPNAHPTARMGYDHGALNKRVAAAAFDRARMAKCWVPRTRKAHSRAAKAEASARRYLARFESSRRIDAIIVAAKAEGAIAVSADESDREVPV